MPINKAYPIEVLMEAIKTYYSKTNRRVTIEYVMLKNVNDSESDAKKLANLLKGMNVYVNLIPYNETNHLEFKKSDKNTLLNFGKILQDNNITVTIRKEYGGDIDAACGQLRSKEVEL
jgi:23S rRNA (adenine2503-C2)-methyltransferase